MSGISTFGTIQKRTVVTAGEFAGLPAIEDADPQDLVDQLLDAGDVNLLTDAEYTYFLALFSLTPSNDDILQRKAGAWTNRTIAQYKSDLSLNLVNNTSDADKPISTLQAIALALKAPLASPAFTGVPTAPTAVPGTNTTQLATTAFVIAQYGGTIIGYNSGDDAVNPTSNAYADAGLLLKQSLTGKDASNGYAGLTLLKINFKNVADTFTSFLTNTNTAARTYTFQDSDDTIVGRATTDTLSNKTFVAPALGTPASGVLTNCSGTANSLTAGDVLNASVIAKVLTGYTSGSGTVASTDTILQAIQKLNGNDALKALKTGDTFTGLITSSLNSATANAIKALNVSSAGGYNEIRLEQSDGAHCVAIRQYVDNHLAHGGNLIFLTDDSSDVLQERLKLLKTGVVEIPFGQLKFPATQNASSDANTLDDYEEGTCTVAMASDTGSITIHSSYATMNYVKIGKKVFITGHFLATSVSSPTGAWKITGLPFTCGTTEKNYATLSVRPEGFGATVVQPIHAYIPINTTYILVEKFVTGAMAQMASDAIASSGFMISGTYLID